MQKIFRSRDRTGDKPWVATDIACMNNIGVRLHWIDAPYRCHVNDGEKVFTVLDGIVDMHYRKTGTEKQVALHGEGIFFAGAGCEHVAHPHDPARILVVEKQGSV